jgi:hypothetical protein
MNCFCLKQISYRIYNVSYFEGNFILSNQEYFAKTTPSFGLGYAKKDFFNTLLPIEPLAQ